MTVRCPRCGTQYRRPAGRGGASETFRCARCRHVFDAARDEPRLAAAEPEEDEEFTFGDDEPEDDAGEPADAADDDEPGDDAKPRRRAGRGAPAPPSGASAARFAFRAMLAVTAGYAVLSIYLYTHPQSTRDVLERVPLIGQSLSERHLQPESIQLADLRGEYQRVKGDHLVFLVSGTAVNTSTLPVRGIQVEGRIVGGSEQRQTVFVGAAPPDVRDLSLREIALLQTIEPAKDWALAPGEQAGFLIAFADAPPDLREFTAEVVAVQAPRRPAPGAAPNVARR